MTKQFQAKDSILNHWIGEYSSDWIYDFDLEVSCWKISEIPTYDFNWIEVVKCYVENYIKIW